MKKRTKTKKLFRWMSLIRPAMLCYFVLTQWHRIVTDCLFVRLNWVFGVRNNWLADLSYLLIMKLRCWDRLRWMDRSRLLICPIAQVDLSWVSAACLLDARFTTSFYNRNILTIWFDNALNCSYFSSYFSVPTHAGMVSGQAELIWGILHYPSAYSWLKPKNTKIQGPSGSVLILAFVL